MLGSFDGGEGDASSFGDVEVGAAAFGTTGVRKHRFGDEVDGFGFVCAKFFLEVGVVPGVCADVAGEMAFFGFKNELNVLETWKLGGEGFESEAQDATVDLLEFTEVDGQFCDGLKVFVCRGGFCGGEDGFSERPFVHRSSAGYQMRVINVASDFFLKELGYQEVCAGASPGFVVRDHGNCMLEEAGAAPGPGIGSLRIRKSYPVVD